MYVFYTWSMVKMNLFLNLLGVYGMTMASTNAQTKGEEKQNVAIVSIQTTNLEHNVAEMKIVEGMMTKSY